jgi:hypothetical protein
MFSITKSGSTAKTEAILKALVNLDISGVLNSSGEKGVAALASATPVDSGLSSDSWTYKVSARGGIYILSWHNIDIENGFPVAIMLQYGYATGTGGYVAGRDYINPAIRPVFEEIKADIRKAVTSR